MDLYLIRHTRPGVAAGTCYGRSDVPLAADWSREADDVLARLAPVDALLASPLSRCRLLAERIAERRAVPLRFDPRLVELDFGAWEGRLWSELDRHETDRWSADYWNEAPPGGETYRSLFDRVGECLQSLETGNARSLAIVSHSGPIRAMVVHLLRMPPQLHPDTRVDYGAILTLRRVDGGWQRDAS